jgi:hypothetical protein
MTGDTQGLEVLHVIGVGDEPELDLVVDLERLGRTTADTGEAVTPLHQFPRPLPLAQVANPASRVAGVPLPLGLSPAVGTAALLQVTSLEA